MAKIVLSPAEREALENAANESNELLQQIEASVEAGIMHQGALDAARENQRKIAVLLETF